MSKNKIKKTATAETAANDAATAKAATTQGKSKAGKAKKISALDAAAQVLAAKKEMMSAPELIAAMAEQKLWSWPNGKTPAVTLYSAILREINTKRRDSRFTRPERGKFAPTGAN
jgi:hypothetical protein